MIENRNEDVESHAGDSGRQFEERNVLLEGDWSQVDAPALDIARELHSPLEVPRYSVFSEYNSLQASCPSRPSRAAAHGHG
jgi:hypothetical protein